MVGVLSTAHCDGGVELREPEDQRARAPCHLSALGIAAIRALSRAASGVPEGVSVGHATDAKGRTGCTVVLVPDGAVGGVEVRGGAPGTLGTDALRPGTLIERVHAALLTGGSVFGLSAASGVFRYLEERGVGQEIGSVRVPVVVGAVIFDLLVGDPGARPSAEDGYTACASATSEPSLGPLGAGAGASVAKAGDASESSAGGVDFASASVGDAVVSTVIASSSRTPS